MKAIDLIVLLGRFLLCLNSADEFLNKGGELGSLVAHVLQQKDIQDMHERDLHDAVNHQDRTDEHCQVHRALHSDPKVVLHHKGHSCTTHRQQCSGQAVQDASLSS